MGTEAAEAEATETTEEVEAEAIAEAVDAKNAHEQDWSYQRKRTEKGQKKHWNLRDLLESLVQRSE